MSAGPSEVPSTGWLNRNVIGAGLTSFLADACYETATAILPAFLAALGAPAVSLGITEGVADAVSSFVKLGAGWWGDRFGHRKAIVVAGYALTAVATAFFALAFVWPLVLLGRVVAWFGKGIRGPLRNAILAESVPASDRGKVFGFHRAGDTLGAIVGPLLAYGLLDLLSPLAAEDPKAPYPIIFLLTLIPGLGAALSFALLVKERRRTQGPVRRFWASLAAMPVGFRRLLVGVGVFGAGDFAPALLILAAKDLLAPAYGATEAAKTAALLYGLRNAVYAASSFPVGALGDRLGRRGLLVAGYVLAGLVVALFAALLHAALASWPLLTLLFGLAGVYIAIEDALEAALTADLVPDETLRGTAYGLMGTVNGVGDFVSSALVGALWSAFGPVPGFACAAALMLAGAVLLYRVR